MFSHTAPLCKCQQWTPTQRAKVSLLTVTDLSQWVQALCRRRPWVHYINQTRTQVGERTFVWLMTWTWTVTWLWSRSSFCWSHINTEESSCRKPVCPPEDLSSVGLFRLVLKILRNPLDYGLLKQTEVVEVHKLLLKLKVQILNKKESTTISWLKFKDKVQTSKFSTKKTVYCNFEFDAMYKCRPD